MTGTTTTIGAPSLRPGRSPIVQTFVRDAHRIVRGELEREGITAKPAADRRRADRAWRAAGDERFAAGYVPREDKAVSTPS